MVVQDESGVVIERVVRGGVLHDVQMQAISRERGHDGPVSVRRRFRRGEVADAEPVKGLGRVFGKIAAVEMCIRDRSKLLVISN